MSRDRAEIAFPAGASASRLLHQLLRDAAESFPEELADAAVPDDGRAFRKSWPTDIVRFEAARAGSARRSEIARFLAEHSRAAMQLEHEGEPLPLPQALAIPAPALECRTIPMAGSGRLTPEVPWADRVYRGRELLELADRLVDEERASQAAADALRWVVREATDEAGEIDLSGHRFAILGAGAEIAPTPLLLAAGAELLWIDVAPPSEALQKDSTLSGRIQLPKGGADLLGDPRAVLATVQRFAEEGALDLGLYAYAGGRGREWRLGAGMNAIAAALPQSSLRSISLLVSPTSPAVRLDEEREVARARHAQRPAWQRALEAMRLLGDGDVVRVGEVEAMRAVLSVQGASYQAAQYLEKLMAAEAWAIGPDAPRISANTAAITRTRSLRHPVFEAAFIGAPRFSVETFAPETTRHLNGLLMLHDLLNPAAPGATRAEPGRLFEQRVHGGLYATPYTLEPAITAAAVIGMARRPGLALRLLRGR